MIPRSLRAFRVSLESTTIKTTELPSLVNFAQSERNTSTKPRLASSVKQDNTNRVILSRALSVRHAALDFLIQSNRAPLVLVVLRVSTREVLDKLNVMNANQARQQQAPPLLLAQHAYKVVFKMKVLPSITVAKFASRASTLVPLRYMFVSSAQLGCS